MPPSLDMYEYRGLISLAPRSFTSDSRAHHEPIDSMHFFLRLGCSDWSHDVWDPLAAESLVCPAAGTLLNLTHDDVLQWKDR